MAGTASVADTALTGGDAPGDVGAGSGDASSVDSAGESCADESDLASSNSGDIEMDEADNGIVGSGGDGGALNDGVLGQDKGERISSLSTSTLLRRFLVFFAGGGWGSGEEGCCGVVVR
jgi:hypothetical protein